jgi:hypothetical protein
MSVDTNISEERSITAEAAGCDKMLDQNMKYKE